VIARVLVVVALGSAGACGPAEEPLIATFTSDVVQRDTCRTQGDDERELCVRDESVQRLTVDLIEDDRDRVWISGIPIEGESDRRLLGTRDDEGGFLFIQETFEENDLNGCRFDRFLQLSLRLPDGVSEAAARDDTCTALVGRELRTFTTSDSCDDVNDPPVEITRIQRKRWEPALDCGEDP
jgi:hypothetical protein